MDIWRVNPEKKSFTWSQNSLMIFCRLDYWLISNALHDLVKVTDIIPAIRTDHSAITLEFVITLDDVKGPGVWKMNCSLLDDEEYVNVITESIPIWLAQGHKDLSDYRCIWDWLKYNVRAYTIQYSKKKARERKEKEKRLQEQLTNVWYFGGSAMVTGLLLKGSWFSSRRFFSSLPLPLLSRFLRSLARTRERAPQKSKNGKGFSR